MTKTLSNAELEENARRGQEMFEKHVRDKLTPDDDGKYVAIDIYSGAYTIDKKDVTAAVELKKKVPTAFIYLMRAGYETTYHMLGTRRVESS